MRLGKTVNSYSLTEANLGLEDETIHADLIVAADGMIPAVISLGLWSILNSLITNKA